MNWVVLCFVKSSLFFFLPINMLSSSSSTGLLRSEDCSGSSSNLLVLKAIRRHEVESNVSLLSLASEEDDEVQFDSKQLFLLNS